MLPGLDLKSAIGYANQFQKSGLFTTAVAYAGKPIKWDLSKSDGALHEKHKSECKGVFFYLKKYVLTWGNTLGAAGIALSALVGNFLPVSQEGGGKAKGLLTSLLSLGGLLGIVGSIWGTSSGKTVEHFVRGPERDAKIGADLLKVVEKSLNEEEKTALTSFYLNKDINPLRYNKVDQKFVEGYLNNPDKPALGFFVGKSGTGKTRAMQWITASIIAHEKANQKDADVWQISGQALQEIINGKVKEGESKVGLLNEAISLAGSVTGVDPSIILGVANQMRQDKIKLLKGVLYNIKQKLEEAKAMVPPKRLIVQIDEIDNLFDVAKEDGKYNEDFVNEISGLLGELFEKDKGYDILMTSNLTLDELCGLGTNFSDREQLERSKLAKAHGRLNQPTVCHTFEIPDVETAPSIFSVYMKNNGSHFSIDTSQEDKLTSSIKEELSSKIPPLKGINFAECVNEEQLNEKFDKYMLRLALERLEGRGIEGIVASLIVEKKSDQKIDNQMFINKVVEYLTKERVPKLDRNDSVYKAVCSEYTEQKQHIIQAIKQEARDNFTEVRVRQLQEAINAKLREHAPDALKLLTALDEITLEQLALLREAKLEQEVYDFAGRLQSGEIKDMATAQRSARRYLKTIKIES